MRLVAISYDPSEVRRDFAAKRGIEYTLLSDPGSKTIDAYRVRNHEAAGRTSGIPHPTIFLVDRGGAIRFKLRYEGYRVRPTSAEIIDAAGKLASGRRSGSGNVRLPSGGAHPDPDRPGR